MTVKKKAVIGLDIGTTKVACFVGVTNDFGKLEIISVGKSESLGVKRGIVHNIEKTINSIKESVAKAQDNLDGQLTINSVYVGVAGQHIKSLQHRGMLMVQNPEGEISQADIDRIVEDMYKIAMPPGDEIIDVIPQEYTVDAESGIKDPIGMAGRRLEANFHIITGNVTAIKNIHKCVERADLKVKNLILEPVASSEAVLTEEEKEAGVVLVDIGGGTTDVAIFHEGTIRHTAVIPFGGDIITEDIKNGCTILKKQAEAAKVLYGSAIAEETNENKVISIAGLKGRAPKEITLKALAGIIQARMEEIIDLVNYEIQQSGIRDKLIGGIVLTGGGAQLQHIKQLFEYMTGMDTRIGYPTEHLASENKEILKSPMYSTGIGLVLKGIEEEKRKIKGIKETVPPVKGTANSKKKKGGLFDNILGKSGSFFSGIKDLFDMDLEEEEDENDKN